MVWLGNVSFGLYICQVIPIIVLRTLLFGGATFSFPVATALLFGLFLTTLLFAWLLHRFVETPVMRNVSRGRESPRQRALAHAGLGAQGRNRT
jgi:peptidoglycan/LPS O-acetylase OafA/YrhL